ncbi:hypothetical protein HK099_002649 [Clydaea vesicula]|uniref:Uncharacterized protein n=1 Tax=Clydaea vesicula TaxID=447962 RepID=A0AAD5Y3B1_9FUNG|nr:hypothetical protein HK099_002649 [Clydaea vesicula]
MTHQHCVSTPFILFESDYNYFKELLLKHSIHRPPYSVRIFSLLQIKQISEYVTNTYFRHYLMYKYAFTKKVLMDLTIGTKTDGEQPEEECVIENIEPIIQPPPEDFNEQCEVPAEVVDSTIIEENAFPDSSIPTEEDIIVRISPEVKAKQDLRQFIIANLTSKVEELKLQLQSKISMQDEMLHSQLKKIEDSLKKEEEKIEKGGKKGKEGRKK